MSTTKLRIADGMQTILSADELRPSVLNPRFDLGDLEELTESIRSVGILQPLVVTPEGEHYKLVTGHRRFAAGQAAGLTDFPVVIRHLDDAQCQLAMLIENTQRRELSPVEEGVAYARLMKQHGYTQRQLAEKVGCSDWKISTRLAILKLPKDQVDAIHTGELSVAVALGYTEENRQERRATGVTVRQPPRWGACDLERHRAHDAKNCEIARSLVKA